MRLPLIVSPSLLKKLKMRNKRATIGGSFVALVTWWRTLKPAEWLMLCAFGVYCFVFPWAMLLMSFDWMPFGMEWMSSLLLAMLGLASAGWLWTNFGRIGLIVSAGIFTVGVALEYMGVLTSFPFGSYKYTGVLVPELPGGVPVAIGFAWLLIVVSGLFTAQSLLLSRRSPVVSRRLSVCIGALLAVGLDLLLEPVAYHIKNYWQWLANEGGYYGIPWSNFLAWFVAAFVMNLAVSAILKSSRPTFWAWMPVALFTMNVLLFGTVNIAHGYWLSGIIALILITAIALGRPATGRRRPKTP